jgi:hypothetical protein
MKNHSSAFYFLLVFFTCYLSPFLHSQGFLKTNQKLIVNGSGEQIKLKGIGLGGWLVQEGYMLKTPYSTMGAEHEIKREIEKLVGPAKTEELYSIYHLNYVRKIDIDSISAWGFNSIRLPMHYNKLISVKQPLTFNEKGFSQIDSLLSWCEKNRLYLILDLHAAPGGQSNEPISDYDKTKPSLWESEENKNLTVELWREIASRYVNKEWIGGYDLINEPKWELPPNNQPLRDLYIRITDAIRSVDTNHIVFIEGNWFATDFSGLTPPWDDNMVYSFHKYWSETDRGSINYLLDLRNTYNIPLWLGESGENSNDWFRECVDLMEVNNIGWAWWPHKKIDNISGPLSAPIVPQYQQLLNYWNGTGVQPSQTYAYAALLTQFEKLKFENCVIQPDVYKSLLEPKPTASIPYKHHVIPGTIFGSDYDLGGQLVGYVDKDYKNTGSGSYNSGWSYRNDGVDIEICTDTVTNGFNVGWIQTGEWLKYTVNILQEGNYDLYIRVASTKTGGKISFSFNDTNLTGLVDIPLTGGWQSWKTVKLGNYFLPAGQHALVLRFYFDGYNFNYFEILPSITGNIDQSTLIRDYELFQNFPNPFNPKTTIIFELPKYSHVKLGIFNLLGHKIEDLVNSTLAQGLHTIIWDASKYSSGNYYYILESGESRLTRKMILLK